MADDKFTIVFKRSPDYKIYPGNVVFGGPTPDAAGVFMNFCVDHAPNPSYTQHPVHDGKVDVSEVLDQAVAGNLEREMLCGVTMTLNQAKVLAGWLNQIIANIERQRGE